MHSGPMSLARCTNAEKSGLATGNRTEPMISPPASLNARWNAPSASWAGPKSDTIEYTLRTPLRYAQAPNASFSWGVVREVRTMYGDLVVMTDVAAFMTTIIFFASADT